MPKTDWCTARTDGSNLFYNYIGRAGGNFMLFYIIKDNAQNDYDYLSVGFEDSEPVLPCGAGGESVNRANKGLSEEKLWQIWRGYYPTIMDMMQKKCDELGGVSPAYPIIKAATTDLNKFKKLIKGNSKKEAEELIVNLLKYLWVK